MTMNIIKRQPSTYVSCSPEEKIVDMKKLCSSYVHIALQSSDDHILTVL